MLVSQSRQHIGVLHVPVNLRSDNAILSGELLKYNYDREIFYWTSILQNIYTFQIPMCLN